MHGVNTMNEAERNKTEALLAAFFANGGTIEHCPPAFAEGAFVAQRVNVRRETLEPVAETMEDSLFFNRF